MILTCRNIQKSFGAGVVLRDVSFSIEDGEKAAVVGVNGAGKTTLFKIITEELQADSGEISFRKGVRIGYLSQMTDLDLEGTVYSELTSVFDGLIRLENEIRETERGMGGLLGSDLDVAMERYARLTNEFEEKNGYEYKSRIRGVIKGLGFDEAELSLPVRQLSGGQKTRTALGKLLLSTPDLLLLDEPTNHLDIDSVSWLEDIFIKNYPGSVIVISHDRYFLDKTVTKVIEIEYGSARSYNGNYTYFAYKKETDREIELKHYLDQQKEIRRQEDIIKQLRSFNREKSIRRAESKEKLLAKVDRLEKPPDAPDKMRIVLEPSTLSGVDVLSVKGVSKVFRNGEQEDILFRNVSFEIKRGEIVALIGANGIGKSTLFKMIYSGSAEIGSIRLGANVNIGYYDQEHSLLSDEKTIFQEMSDEYPKLGNGKIRNILAAFMFTGDNVFKKISSLSGGEKGRVSLAKLMLGNVNFLMLDEPTNHLDMFSKEILEDALRNYMGTVFYISHDRYFINNTADKIFELGCGGVGSFLGNYDDYALSKAEGEGLKTVLETEVFEKELNGRKALKNKKEELAEERRRIAKINRLEAEIAEAEKEIVLCDERLALSEIYSDLELVMAEFNKKTAFTNKLEELYSEWESEVSYSFDK